MLGVHPIIFRELMDVDGIGQYRFLTAHNERMHTARQPRHLKASRCAGGVHRNDTPLPQHHDLIVDDWMHTPLSVEGPHASGESAIGTDPHLMSPHRQSRQIVETAHITAFHGRDTQ